MHYFTLKLYAPEQVFLIPSGASIIDLVQPGVLKDRDGHDYGDAPCPSIVVAVEQDSVSAELQPIYVKCHPITPESRLEQINGQFNFDTGKLSCDQRGSVFSEANSMVHLGKFTIRRRGQDVTYFVSCESRPMSSVVPVAVASIMGDSSAGLAEGALPRAMQ